MRELCSIKGETNDKMDPYTNRSIIWLKVVNVASYFFFCLCRDSFFSHTEGLTPPNKSAFEDRESWSISKMLPLHKIVDCWPILAIALLVYMYVATFRPMIKQLGKKKVPPYTFKFNGNWQKKILMVKYNRPIGIQDIVFVN